MHAFHRLLKSCTLLLLYGGSAFAAAGTSDNDLTELSIEELMAAKVTSVGKKQQNLADAPAAVYVLTAEDIHRSGASYLPELLAMVPGVEVATINAHQYSISIRGFSGQWSSKLLVLVDSRSVYTQTFSGVYWDALDLMLEDIERIEVIRGPGATLWGANAVNGVINIITRSATRTEGALLSVEAADDGGRRIAARYGAPAGDWGAMRAFVTAAHIGATQLQRGGDGDDEWSNTRTGFRGDWDTASGDRIMVAGDAYRLNFSSPLFDPYSGTTVVGALSGEDGNGRGHSLVASWTHAYSLTEESTLQFYLDSSRREDFVTVEESYYNLEFQHRFVPWETHDLVWGAHVRSRRDHLSSNADVAVLPGSESDILYSVFAQDEMRFADGRYRITLGSKFEHNAYSGWEIQPSLRGFIDLDAHQKLWAAASRSARTSARADRDLSTSTASMQQVDGLGQIPVLLQFNGNKNFHSEKMRSFELGYRALLSADLSWDLSLFFNRYTDLRGIDYSLNARQLPVILSANIANTIEGDVLGGEATLAWDIAPHWRTQSFVGYLNMDLHDSSAAQFQRFYAGTSPRWQAGFRNAWDISPRWSLNIQAKYVDALTHPYNSAQLPHEEVPSYVDLDASLSWRVTPSVELALIGKNLLDGSGRVEYVAESSAPVAEISRTVALKAQWSY